MWPFRRHRGRGDDQTPRDVSGIRQAERTLAEARAREPRVAEVVDDVDRLIRANHFGPAVEQAFRGAVR